MDKLGGELAETKVKEVNGNKEDDDKDEDGVKFIGTDNDDESLECSADSDDDEPNYVVHGEDDDKRILEEGYRPLDDGEPPAKDEFVNTSYDETLNRSRFSQDSSIDRMTKEHDTAKDVMNMPPSYVAPSHRPSDFGNILRGSREVTQEEVEFVKRRREELEAEVEADRLKHEQDRDEGIDDRTSVGSGPSLMQLQTEAGAMEVAPGIVVVDPEELDKLLAGDADTVTHQKAMDDEESRREALQPEWSPLPAPSGSKGSVSSMAVEPSSALPPHMLLPSPESSSPIDTPATLHFPSPKTVSAEDRIEMSSKTVAESSQASVVYLLTQLCNSWTRNEHHSLEASLFQSGSNHRNSLHRHTEVVQIA